MKVLVVGGGVVGSAVAFFAARRGARVTLVDAGIGAASAVPSALVNPVRGQQGKVDPLAVTGLSLTWLLVDELRALGYVIPGERSGVWRPVPDETAWRRWSAHLPAPLPHRWVHPSALPELAEGWFQVLELPTAGWLDGAAFTRSLRTASGAHVIGDWADRIEAQAVELASGDRLTADRVVWCGGSIGASRRGLGGQHRGGSLLITPRPLASRVLSYGAYVAPSALGGVVGATFEAPSSVFNDAPAPAASTAWLLDRTRRLLGVTPEGWTATWSGSRLSSRVEGRQADGTWALAGLGSKGFLLGPLLARELVSQPDFWAG